MAVLAGVAVAGAYTRLHASRILVRHLHGWSMWSNYRVLIALEGIILLAVLAWAPYEVMRRRAEFEALFAGDPTQQAPALQTLDMLPALLVVAGRHGRVRPHAPDRAPEHRQKRNQ